MKLSELKPGDKATVEIEVVDRNGGSLYFHSGGQRTNNSIYVHQAKNIEVTNVIRKPVEPAAGQMWRHTETNSDVEILFTDSKSSYVERKIDKIRYSISSSDLKGYYTFVR